jgi:hypothetical protein
MVQIQTVGRAEAPGQYAQPKKKRKYTKELSVQINGGIEQLLLARLHSVNQDAFIFHNSNLVLPQRGPFKPLCHTAEGAQWACYSSIHSIGSSN